MAKLSTIYKFGLDIRVECEACRHKYRHKKTLQKTIPGWHHSEAKARLAALDAVKEAVDAQFLGTLGFKRCPECGYVQSWMRLPFLLKAGVTGLYIGGIPPFLLFLGLYFASLNWPLPEVWSEYGWTALGIGIIGGPIVGFVCGILYLRKRQKDAGYPAPIPPQGFEIVKPD